MEASTFAKMQEQARPLLDKYRDGIYIVSLVLPGTKLMDSSARSVSMEQTQRLAPHLKGAVNVFMGSGLGITTFRTMVSTLSLIVRAEFPIKTVATVREAATALSQLGSTFTPASFETAASLITSRVSSRALSVPA